MTTYRVPVRNLALASSLYFQDVEGFRFIKVEGLWHWDPEVTICTFEDDNAPAELEGKLVEPTMMRHADGRLTVLDRQVWS